MNNLREHLSNTSDFFAYVACYINGFPPSRKRLKPGNSGSGGVQAITREGHRRAARIMEAIENGDDTAIPLYYRQLLALNPDLSRNELSRLVLKEETDAAHREVLAKRSDYRPLVQVEEHRGG